MIATFSARDFKDVYVLSTNNVSTLYELEPLTDKIILSTLPIDSVIGTYRNWPLPYGFLLN